jgi:hypothetical protein
MTTRHFVGIPVAAAAFVFGGLVASCSSGGGKQTTGAADTGAAAGANGGGGGSSGAAVESGGGAAGAIATTGTSSGASGAIASAGSSAAGATTGTTGAAGSSSTGATQPSPEGGTGSGASSVVDGSVGDSSVAGCAPGAILCDGFEDYPILPSPFDKNNNIIDLTKIGDTMPSWLSYHFHGPPRVDASKPFVGKQEYHVNTETGHIVAADIIKEAPDGVDLWPAAHYGRFMMWLNAVPPMSTFGIVSESGLLPGSTTETAEFTLGGVNGKLAFTYTQRKRIVKNGVGVTPRRGGGPEIGDPPAQVQCAMGATSETIKPGKWVCVEWMVDRTKPELHMWLDGVPQTQVDVSGGGGACTYGTAPAWQGPDHFTELDLGWEVWGNDTTSLGVWEAWFDEFAIGTEKLGCPTP